MEIVFELIFGVILEAVLGVAGEILVELGFHAAGESISNRGWKRVLTGAGYVFFGALLGWLSLMIFPKFAFGSPVIPIVYFIASPVIAGLALCAVNWILHRDIDGRVGFFDVKKFVYGALFVLTFSITRSLLG